MDYTFLSTTETKLRNLEFDTELIDQLSSDKGELTGLRDQLEQQLKHLELTAHLVDVLKAAADAEETPDESLLTQSADLIQQLMTNPGDNFETQANEVIGSLRIAPAESDFTFFVVEEGANPGEPIDHPELDADTQSSEASSTDTPTNQRREVKPVEGNTEIENDPEMLEVFAQETSDHLENIESHILEIDGEDAAEALDAIFRAFHTIKGTSAFFGFSGIQQLAHEIETLLDTVREGQRVFSPALSSLTLEVRDVLMRMSERAIQEQIDLPCSADLLDRVVNFSDDNVAQGGESSTQQDTTSDTQATSNEGADTQEKLKEKSASASRNEIVKVDATRLDYLVDLVGELVIGHSIISESIGHLNDAPDRLMQGTKHLTSITRELQSLSTSLRMVPIKPVFQRMKRLVRDLSVQTGKTIEFEVIGENTEVDKSLVDEIGDPLVHLIRNAVDHGIEDPEGRKQANKPASGNLTLSASQRGSAILIELKDDGKGLDRDRIYAKAVERGLIEPDADLPDKKVFELIMQPGFSTAETVSDVSGRGVGMDVVNQAIEALKGQLDVNSEKGRGTSFTLRLPLTLAIIDGVVAKVGDERYIIPSASVVQSIRTEGHANTTVAGDEEVVVYREQAMPLVRLSELFDVPPPQTSSVSEDGPLMMIIDNDSQRFALMVDDLVGKQQVVIKSLDLLLKDTQGIAGSAIMPDGTVGLILDVDSLTLDLKQEIKQVVNA